LIEANRIVPGKLVPAVSDGVPLRLSRKNSRRYQHDERPTRISTPWRRFFFRRSHGLRGPPSII